MVEVRALSNHEVRFCRIPPLGFNLDVMPCPSAHGNFFLFVLTWVLHVGEASFKDLSPRLGIRQPLIAMT